MQRPPGLPDDYTPVEHIASGGQADVWRVSRRSDGTSWVAKLYHSADPAHLGEALALSRLSHPAFPRIHGVSLTAGETHCLLIEHIPGETLDVWAAQHRSSPTFVTKATHVLTHLAAALAALHELDIAHRDLTPANVLLLPAFDEDPKRPGGLKLIDLGIATAVHEQTRAGTRPFRAPESFVRDAPAGSGAQADVFAWGVLAVWLFSGRFPTGLSADASEDELRARYRDGGPLAEGTNGAPARLRDVVAGALRRDPRDRIASGTRLREAIRAAEQPTTQLDETAPRIRVQAPPPAAPAAVAPPAPTAKPATRTPWFIPFSIGALGGLLGGVLAVLLWLPKPEPPATCDDRQASPDARRRACERLLAETTYLDIDRSRALGVLLVLAEQRGESDRALMLSAEGWGACRLSLCPDSALFEQKLAALCAARSALRPGANESWGVVTARGSKTGAVHPLPDRASTPARSLTRGTCVVVERLVTLANAKGVPEGFAHVQADGSIAGWMHADVLAPVPRYPPAPPAR